MAEIRNVLTVDLEEWFQVTSFSHVLGRESWEECESRVYRQTLRILALCSQYRVSATFFVVGWVAKRNPELICRIVAEGHEVGIHGYWHCPVNTMQPEDFRVDVLRAKAVVEQLTRKQVVGFRAPSWSLSEDDQWAFDILSDCGFCYDSSVWSPNSNYPYKRKSRDGLWEIPLSTIGLGKYRLPFSGGLFLRMLPYRLICFLIRKMNKRGLPVLVYVHPWELDPKHPRINVALSKRFIHYYNLHTTEHKLEQLLHDFEFSSLNVLLDTYTNTN